MPPRKFRTSRADAGVPLAEFLAARLGEPKARAVARVAAGGVYVADRRARDPELRLATRQTIVVHDEKPPAKGWRVIHEDDDVLVVDKPPGLPSQATRGATGALDEQVAKAHPGARLLHRLD